MVCRLNRVSREMTQVLVRRRPRESDLIWNRGLRGCGQGQTKPYRPQLASTLTPRGSLQGEEVRTQTGTEGRWPCEDGTEIEGLGPQIKEPLTLKKQAAAVPGASGGTRALQTPWSGASELQLWETTFLLFQVTRLRCFVVEARGRGHRHK